MDFIIAREGGPILELDSILLTFRRGRVGYPLLREEPEPMNEQLQPVIRVSMMPRDTNAHGTIFGGVILSYIDQAGAVEAYRHVNQKLVTVAIKEVVFHEPVQVGDLVSLFGRVTRFGRTSITVAVDVYAHRLMSESAVDVKVTEAELTYVAIDGNGQPTPLKRAGSQSLIPAALRGKTDEASPLQTDPNSEPNR